MIEVKHLIVPYIVFATTLLVAGCTPQEKPKRAERVNVKTMKVTAGKYAVGKNFMGTVEEEDGANVTFGVLGTVVKVMVEEGQFVKKGQPIAEVDGQNVRNAHEISAATLKQAEDAYRRLKDLYDKGTLPEIKMVEMETKLAQARATEAISRKSVSEIVLHAPFSGYVASCNIHEGASVMPGVSGIRLVKIDRVKVKLSVPERDIGQVEKEQQVRFTVTALGDSVFTGKVVARGVTANPINHTYSVTVLTDNARHMLLPGMVCKAQLEKVNDNYAIVIPQQAIMISGHEKFVWTAREGRAHRQPITTGDILDEGVVVESGLTTGDVIIIEGQQKVCEDSAL